MRTFMHTATCPVHGVFYSGTRKGLDKAIDAHNWGDNCAFAHLAKIEVSCDRLWEHRYDATREASAER